MSPQARTPGGGHARYLCRRRNNSDYSGIPWWGHLESLASKVRPVNAEATNGTILSYIDPAPTVNRFPSVAGSTSRLRLRIASADRADLCPIPWHRALVDDPDKPTYLKAYGRLSVVDVRGGGPMATLYDRVVKGMEVALETAQKSVEVLMVKAEDTAEVIKFRLEKTRLEREISKKFAELGSKLYEKSVREGKEAGILQDAEVQQLIDSLKRLDQELAHIQALEEQEMEKQRAAS